MYAAYRCLSEATGVELSTKAKLEKSDREFLVTACGTCLRLYEVEKETTLRSVAVHDLYGRITGIHAIPSGSGGVDVLVLVFGLKVSVVEYDIARCAFRTLEIHDFTNRTGSDSSKTIMDPQKRCIAIITSDSVIMMPVINLDSSTVLKPFTVTFRDAGLLEFGFVRDVVFLDGYVAPTLLFLQENSKQTWCGNMFARKNTCRITGVSVDFRRQRLHVVWHVVDRLPHDCSWLRAVRTL